MLEVSGGRGPVWAPGSMKTEIAAIPSEKIRCWAGIGEPGIGCNRLATRRKPGGRRSGRQPPLLGSCGMAAALRARAHPLEAGCVDGRLDVAGRNLVLHLQLREANDFDRLADAIGHDRLQRHGRFFVEPEPVTVAVNVLRPHVDDADIATQQATAFLADGKLVIAIERWARRGQRLEQRAVVAARLHDHDAAVRQVSVDFFARAHDFTAAAVERHQAFEALAVRRPGARCASSRPGDRSNA